jgi:hypothetical protein
MIACHCVMLQFLLIAAMRDASNIDLGPAILAKHSAQAMAISRTLRQWVAQFEKVRKRNETHAKEATQVPLPDGRAVAATASPAALAPAVAAGSQSRSQCTVTAGGWGMIT